VSTRRLEERGKYMTEMDAGKFVSLICWGALGAILQLFMGIYTALAKEGLNAVRRQVRTPTHLVLHIGFFLASGTVAALLCYDVEGIKPLHVVVAGLGARNFIRNATEIAQSAQPPKLGPTPAIQELI
jgi:hypothetical protein